MNLPRKENGIKTESKIGVNILGNTGEVGASFQTHLEDGIFTKDTKTITKVGGIFKDSMTKGIINPNRENKISSSVGKSVGSQNVIETQYGQTKVSTENSIKFSIKLIVGAEITIKY